MIELAFDRMLTQAHRLGARVVQFISVDPLVILTREPCISGSAHACPLVCGRDLGLCETSID